MATNARVLTAATAAFAQRGYEGTSLDALAGDLGLTKQTILYHFGSKSGLLDAVLDAAARDLVEALEGAVAAAEPGWDQVDALVRAAFALAVRRPELLALLREVSRLGSPASSQVLRPLQPLVDRALAGLEAGMAAGSFRPADPRLTLVTAYAAVVGVVTDPEALRAVGLSLDLRRAVALRRTAIEFLRAGLTPLPQEPSRPPADQPGGSG